MNFLCSIAALLLSVAVVLAQEPKQGNENRHLTNCPSGASHNQTSSPGAQAVEKSAILPSAEGHEKSAAPTVQRNGESVAVRDDCPQDPNQPKPKG